MEVVPLSHLYAVKDMVARIDHFFSILIDEGTAWICNNPSHYKYTKNTNTHQSPHIHHKRA